MQHSRLVRWIAVGLGLALLVACSFEPNAQVRSSARPEAYWPERSTVFLADTQAGVVRALNIRSGIVPLGEIVTPARASVLALSLDISAKQLWVLDAGVLHAYDAVTLRLTRRWPAPYGVVLKALERDAEGTVLAVAANGYRYRPDPSSLALRPAGAGPRVALSGF